MSHPVRDKVPTSRDSHSPGGYAYFQRFIAAHSIRVCHNGRRDLPISAKRSSNSSGVFRRLCHGVCIVPSQLVWVGTVPTSETVGIVWKGSAMYAHLPKSRSTSFKSERDSRCSSTPRIWCWRCTPPSHYWSTSRWRCTVNAHVHVFNLPSETTTHTNQKSCRIHILTFVFQPFPYFHTQQIDKNLTNFC